MDLTEGREGSSTALDTVLFVVLVGVGSPGSVSPGRLEVRVWT